MTTGKIFLIHGEDISKKQSSIRRNGRLAPTSGNSNSNYWSMLHVFSILCLSGLAMSILTLIPRHNSILDQSYWFEISIVAAPAYLIRTAITVLDYIVLFEKDSMITTRIFFKTYFANFLTWIVGYCAIYMIWTMILEYNHPMPFVDLILYFPLKMASSVSLPLMFLGEFSLENESKKKLKKFIWFQLGWIMAIIIKMIVATTFDKLKNTDAQCVMALLIPFSKKFVGFFLSKLMNRIEGGDNERANISLATHINLSFGVWIAVTFVSGRPATVVCMVAVDAVMQLIMTYQIVKLHKKVTVVENEVSKMQKRKAILKLVLAELCEGLVPLAYALSFAMAYYGPNAELLGNVRNGSWAYKMKYITWTFQVMIGLFSIDILCLVLNGSIIWIYCNMNLFKETSFVMKKYWYILAMNMVNEVWFHFYAQDVNFAVDPTGEFSWITNNKNISTTSNLTDC